MRQGSRRSARAWRRRTATSGGFRARRARPLNWSGVTWSPWSAAMAAALPVAVPRRRGRTPRSRRSPPGHGRPRRGTPRYRVRDVGGPPRSIPDPLISVPAGSWSVVRFAAGGDPHEPAHGAGAGADAGRVARDHARILPSPGELHVAGGRVPTRFVSKYTARAQLKPLGCSRAGLRARETGGGGGRPARFCQEKTLGLAEQSGSTEHDGFRVPYLSGNTPKPHSMDRPVARAAGRAQRATLISERTREAPLP